MTNVNFAVLVSVGIFSVLHLILLQTNCEKDLSTLRRMAKMKVKGKVLPLQA